MKTTAQLLNEWKSFLLNEHKILSLDELIQTLLQSNRSEEDVNYLRNFWNNNRFITKYTQVIQNELKRTQEPIEEILDVCKLHFFKIYQSAGPNLKDQIGSGNISIDELRKQTDAKSNFNKNEVRQQCRYRDGRPVVGNYQDFDVVYSEADYVVVEPKTIQGSIAWAHGKPDGSEETDQKRRVGWCTGVATENNMFPNYAGNLHMFYVLNTNYDNDASPDRRICLSFRVQNGEPELNVGGGASVNANNRELSKAKISNIQNQRYYQNILQTIQGRKNTSFTEVYAKCTLSQFLRIRAQMIAQNIHVDQKNHYRKEIQNYIRHTNDLDLIKYFLKEESSFPEFASNLYWVEPIPLVVATREDLLEVDPSGELLNQLMDHEDQRVREEIINNYDFLEIDPSGELIKKILRSKNNSSKILILKKYNLLEVDPSGELMNQALNSNDKHVKIGLGKYSNLTKDVLKKLIELEDEDIKMSLLAQEELDEELLTNLYREFKFKVGIELFVHPKCPTYIYNEIKNNLEFAIENYRKKLSVTNKELNLDLYDHIGESNNPLELDALFYTKDAYVQKEIAGNPNASKEVLLKIIEEGDPSFVEDTHGLILDNPNCPDEAVIKIIDYARRNFDVNSQDFQYDEEYCLVYEKALEIAEEKGLKVLSQNESILKQYINLMLS